MDFFTKKFNLQTDDEGGAEYNTRAGTAGQGPRCRYTDLSLGPDSCIQGFVNPRHINSDECGL